MKKLIILSLIIILLIPFSYSDGGCVKVEDDMLVQMSAVPLVPIVGQQVSFLFSFANLKKEPIYGDITGKFKLVKSDNIIFTENFTAKNGIIDLKYTFKNTGLHEIFLEFEINGKKYAPEDFLIEIKDESTNYQQNLLFSVVGIVIGILSAKFIWKKK